MLVVIRMPWDSFPSHNNKKNPTPLFTDGPPLLCNTRNQRHILQRREPPEPASSTRHVLTTARLQQAPEPLRHYHSNRRPGCAEDPSGRQMAAGCSPRSTGRAAGPPGAATAASRPPPAPAQPPLGRGCRSRSNCGAQPGPNAGEAPPLPGEKPTVRPARAALRGAAAPLSGAEGSPASCSLEGRRRLFLPYAGREGNRFTLGLFYFVKSWIQTVR